MGQTLCPVRDTPFSVRPSFPHGVREKSLIHLSLICLRGAFFQRLFLSHPKDIPRLSQVSQKVPHFSCRTPRSGKGLRFLQSTPWASCWRPFGVPWAFPTPCGTRGPAALPNSPSAKRETAGAVTACHIHRPPLRARDRPEYPALRFPRGVLKVP